VSNLRACGPIAYTDNECAKQFLYALDDHVWGIEITALEESTDFTTLDTEKLFSMLLSLMNCLTKIIQITMLLLLVKV
jgi:hypothetical protein